MLGHPKRCYLLNLEQSGQADFLMELLVPFRSGTV